MVADLFEYSPNAIIKIKANEKQIWAAVDAAKKDVLSQIDPRNVINADETGLFWRDVGHYAVVLGDGIKKGIKLAKDRITILMVCSSAGTW